MRKLSEKKKKYIVLGVGGTGSWLCSFMNKLDLKEDDVLLVDGDTVELKNTLRQNFNENDVGQNKAKVIGNKYNFNYSDEFVKDVEFFDFLDDWYNKETEIPVIVGCLDNNNSRKIVDELFKQIDEMIWLDSGNGERQGQSYVAYKTNGEVIFKSPLDIDEKLRETNKNERRPDEISCAEIQESAPQNVVANITAANVLFNLINNLEENRVFLNNKFSFDTISFSVIQEMKE